MQKKGVQVTEALEKYFQPKNNIEQHVVWFLDRTQKANETNEEYTRALYSLASKGDFKAQFNNNIKLRLLAGMKNKHLSIKCQQIEDVKLDDVMSKMRTREIVEQTTTVDWVAARPTHNQLAYGNRQQNTARGMWWKIWPSVPPFLFLNFSWLLFHIFVHDLVHLYFLLAFVCITLWLGGHVLWVWFDLASV